MIKVGVLGTGFGRQHVELYKRLDGVEVVAVYGRNEQKRKEIQEELSTPVTADIQDILTNEEIDVVDICLPTDLHAKWAIEALKHGKHVFCETPLTYKQEEAEEIRRAAEQAGRHVFVDLFYKFSTPHQIAIEKVKNGELGTVKSARSHNKTAPNWGNLGLSKNVTDFHLHNFDFLLELMGMPKRVLANGIDFGEQSVAVTTLSFDEAFAVVESWSNLPKNSPFYVGFEIHGEKGLLKFDAEYGMESKEEFAFFHADGTKEVLRPVMKDDYEQALRHVLECLEGNHASPLIDLSAALQAIKVKDAVLASLAEQQAVIIG
ncbi:Gfo/Idh/MocA family oxidoreductase [Gorillibacterium sp. CAU 1737]|uniref:Gfo/Idh/MocA family protein n=1 Tax=Gorillibacterium sp. CAU 1737 TaxID=3140362 RepID=UPI0032609762